MRKTSMFTIDFEPILIPDGDLSIREEDVVSADSGLDESGVYHRFGVRQGVKSWEFSYARLNQEEYAYMESLFAGKETFSFGYISAPDGCRKSVIAYRSGRSILWHNAEGGQFRDYRFRITQC